MSRPGSRYASLCHASAALGLACRGGFHPLPEDGVPPLADGRAAATLVLLGHTGEAQWPAFTGSREYRDGEADPLDRWSQRAVGELAASVAAGALFPFSGPPWWPFQRWAQRAEGLGRSPLGILIHPEFGLWHSYRGALLLAECLDVPEPLKAAAPCDACIAKPCLSCCPANAITAAGFAAEACATELHRPGGQACLAGGCRARLACPIGAEHRYGDAQAAFHVRAFAQTRSDRTSRSGG